MSKKQTPRKSHYKKSKPWEHESILRSVDQGKHSEAYQDINSVSRSLNKQKQSRAFSHTQEKHKGSKI
ncbi:hypothetical protein JKY79_01090 [Candidatus Babeliales bacterium]|nr:hypothetical protein [Candidatus Babeliales bacterium]